MSSPHHVQLLQRASAAFQRGAIAEAEAICRQVLQVHRDEANALMILGLIRGQAGDNAGAIEFYERARAAMPAHIHVLTNLGAAYRAAGRLHDARLALEEALGIDRRFAIAHNNLGNVLLDLGDAKGARQAYERALVARANYVDPIAGLAALAEQEHRLDDARRLAAKAISLASGHPLARLTQARTAFRQGDAAAAAADLELLLRGTLSATNRIVAEGYLGEAYDKLRRYDDAFQAFSRANALQHDTFAPVFADGRGPMAPEALARLAAVVTNTDIAPWREGPPLKRQAPVFLLGFPRSGTTLLDQILASHPEVTTLEERDAVGRLALDLAGQDNGFERMGDLNDGEIERLRQAYWDDIDAGMAGAPIKRVFVDKLPLNTAFLPIVHRLFPAAKIVFAIRDPRDVVLSCYQQRFGMNPAMFQLLKLETAADFYDRVMRLAQASRAALPLNVHDVHYERVITAFDDTARGLLAFLELPWDDNVRNYAETAKRRPVGTPSAIQVVQPLYTSAQGKWRNYRQFLKPVLPKLAPWVAAYGYDPS